VYYLFVGGSRSKFGMTFFCMQKLVTFNHVFWNSISSFTYYHEVVKTRFSFSFKYFFMFSLILGTLLTIVVSLTFVPDVNQFLKRFALRAPALYPNDLVITVKDGKLATNVTEPLHFPVPLELFSDTPGVISDQNQEYLLTIDTNAQINDYSNSHSLIFVTREQVVVPDSDGVGFRVYPISSFDDGTIDKNAVTKLLDTISPWYPFIVPAMIFILWFTLTILLSIIRLISLSVLTLILRVPAYFMHISLTYRKLFQIGLHALTLPTIIQILMTSFELYPPIPFFNSIVFLLYSLVILSELKRKPATSPIQKL